MTGWTFQEIGDLFLPDVFELYNYWLEYPPVHWLLRWQLGYKGRRRSKTAPLNDSENRVEAFAEYGNRQLGIAPKKKLSELPESVRAFIASVRENNGG